MDHYSTHRGRWQIVSGRRADLSIEVNTVLMRCEPTKWEFIIILLVDTLICNAAHTPAPVLSSLEGPSSPRLNQAVAPPAARQNPHSVLPRSSRQCARTRAVWRFRSQPQRSMVRRAVNIRQHHTQRTSRSRAYRASMLGSRQERRRAARKTY